MLTTTSPSPTTTPYVAVRLEHLEVVTDDPVAVQVVWKMLATCVTDAEQTNLAGPETAS